MPHAQLAGLHEQLLKVWPDNRTINIVCHGHSVPSGYFKTPHVDTFNSYPHLWHVGLKFRYPLAVINVIVTAIGGETSESGAARFERDVLSHRPDLMTIDYALNDRRIGLETAEKSWREMIGHSQSRKIPVALLTPTPDLESNLLDDHDPLCQHAELIRKLAKELNTILVDPFPRFQNLLHNGESLEPYMSQRNHPNRRGHEIVARELDRVL